MSVGINNSTSNNCPSDPLCGWGGSEGTMFGHLIFRRIIKVVATKCHILRLKYTEIDLCTYNVEIWLKGADMGIRQTHKISQKSTVRYTLKLLHKLTSQFDCIG